MSEPTTIDEAGKSLNAAINRLLDTIFERRECNIVEDEFGYLTCSECGAIQPEDYTVYYCWCCGCKVKED